MRAYLLRLTSLFLMAMPLQAYAASFIADDVFTADGNNAQVTTGVSLETSGGPVTFTSVPDGATFGASLSSGDLRGVLTCAEAVCGVGGLSGVFDARTPTGSAVIQAITFTLDIPTTIEGQLTEFLVVAVTDGATYGPGIQSNYSANAGDAIAQALDDLLTDTTKPIINGPVPENNTDAETGLGSDAITIDEGDLSVFDFAVTGDESVEWTITDENGDPAEPFAIDLVTGDLTLNPAIAPGVYVLLVNATDDAGNVAVLTFTVTVVPVAASEIQGPSGEAGDAASRKIVDAGTNTVHTFTIEGATDPDGLWSHRDAAPTSDADKFTINPQTGAFAFLKAPVYVPGGDNLYQVEVVYTYGGREVTQIVTIEVRDTALAALDRSRAEIEQIIVDTEVAKLRGQQNSLRSMTSSARDRLAGGACGGQDGEQQQGATQDDETCRVEETALAANNTEDGLTVSGSNHSVLTFDGYRRIVNLDLQMSDEANVRTLSFNGHFALESFRTENALYGVFAGVSLNKSDVSRGFTGTADSYGLSLGGYAVNEVAKNVFSEAYLSVGRSQNQLSLTDGYLDVAADYGTVETNVGWLLSGLVEKGDWDVLPEFGVQYSRSQSDSIDVVGTIPGDTASVSWDGLTASLLRANLSSDFRYYISGRADDAWVVNFKPGIVCERVEAIAITSDCGWTGGLGLNQQSSDGSRNFSAGATLEKVGTASRKSLSVNYELRF